MSYEPKTDKDKINYLMEKDDRKDNHIVHLQKDVKALTEIVKDLVVSIKGNDLNGNEGIVSQIKINRNKIEDWQEIHKETVIYRRQLKYVVGITLVIVLGIFLNSLRNTALLKDVDKTELHQ